MRIQTKPILIAFGIFLFPLQVLGQQLCEAHFTFDGNLEDTGGNGYDGRMIGKGGTLGTPQYVDGKFGQALQLDGTSAMRSFVDLHFETCPQVTVTAWIQVKDQDRKGVQYVVSTGSGSGPGFQTSGSNLILNGTANGIHQGKAIRANAGWMFVAGVYDYEKGSYTLYSRNRGVDKELGNNVRAPEEAMWVGAFNDGMANAAGGILIDDLRVYGRALRKEEIRKLQIGETEKNLVATELTAANQPGGLSNESLPLPTSIPDDLLTEALPGVGLSPPLIGDNTISNGQSCSDDSQCSSSNGFTGACYSLGGSRATCYQRCDQDDDCNSGIQCISVTLPGGTLDGVCVPD